MKSHFQPNLWMLTFYTNSDSLSLNTQLVSCMYSMLMLIIMLKYADNAILII